MSNTFHLVLLGDAGTGKTTLMTRFLTGEFIRHYEANEQTKEYNIEFITERPKNLLVKIFDTCGQHRLDMTLPEKADGVILFFDLTSKKSYQNLSQWYKMVHEKYNEVPIVVLGNKCDVKDLHVRTEDIDFHRKINAMYFNFSCKSNYNFEKPFTYFLRLWTGYGDLTIQEYRQLEHLNSPQKFLEIPDKIPKVSDDDKSQGWCLLM